MKRPKLPLPKVFNVAVDFDGVLHSYTSPWTNAHTISDPPTPGAMAWILDIHEHLSLRLVVHSCRLNERAGERAVREWLEAHLRQHFMDELGESYDEACSYAAEVTGRIRFAKQKPAAAMYIDDRGFRFQGTFPTPEHILAAKPWNKPLSTAKRKTVPEDHTLYFNNQPLRWDAVEDYNEEEGWVRVLLPIVQSDTHHQGLPLQQDAVLLSPACVSARFVTTEIHGKVTLERDDKE